MAKRGAVWPGALDPTVSSEIRKTRPCLIVSPDELNGRLRTVIVAPMTTGSRPTPFRVPVTFQGKEGLILPDQIRTVDSSRLIRRKGIIDENILTTLSAYLQICFHDSIVLTEKRHVRFSFKLKSDWCICIP